MTNKQTGTSGLVELPEATNRECTVCGATVAAFPYVMACHCREMPWKAASLSPVPVDEVERLRSALGELEQRATATLAAMDRYNAENGTAIVGPSLLQLGKSVANARAALTASRPSDDGEVERLANIALTAELPKQRWSCSDDESGTALTLARQRRWIYDEIKRAALSSLVGEK